MVRAVSVPITPTVLEWAIEESGLSIAELAEKIGVDADDVRAWVKGSAQPSLTSFKGLADALRRPTATFLLSAPPARRPVEVDFRHPPGTSERSPLPEERLRIREVNRLQRTVAWLLDEMQEPTPELPKLSKTSSPEQAGREMRTLLGVELSAQTLWPDVGTAVREWRRALEDIGILVFILPIGAEACRGISIWHDRAPAIVVNTHWNPAARLFTLLHEFAHLLTRTNSFCVEDNRRLRKASLERWCEEAAAAALMPELAVRAFAKNTGRIDLRTAGRVAAHFNVSLRAATLRLVGLDLATWPLYKSIPPAADAKRDGGGGAGRDRTKKRLDEYGHRTARTFVRALQRDVLTSADAMRYLDLGYHDLDELEQLAS